MITLTRQVQLEPTASVPHRVLAEKADQRQLIKLDVAIRLQKNQQLASGVLRIFSHYQGSRYSGDLRSARPQPRTDYEINGMRLNGVFGGYPKSL